jgi:NADH-quinone oxidoreductase subunit M
VLGFVEERTGTRDLDAFGGLAARAPRLQAIMLIAAMALLGLPGLSGFAGEFLILIGSWQTQPAITAVSLIAIVLASAYTLRLFQSMLHGPERVPGERSYGDLRPRELLLVAPLLAAIVFFGIWPGWISDRTPNAVTVPPPAAVASVRHRA